MKGSCICDSWGLHLTGALVEVLALLAKRTLGLAIAARPDLGRSVGTSTCWYWPSFTTLGAAGRHPERRCHLASLSAPNWAGKVPSMTQFSASPLFKPKEYEWCPAWLPDTKIQRARCCQICALFLGIEWPDGSMNGLNSPCGCVSWKRASSESSSGTNAGAAKGSPEAPKHFFSTCMACVASDTQLTQAAVNCSTPPTGAGPPLWQTCGSAHLLPDQAHCWRLSGGERNTVRITNVRSPSNGIQDA